MKITLIIISLKNGGAQTALLSLLRKIDQNKFKVSIISLTDEGDHGKEIKRMGFNLYTISMKKHISIFFSLIKLIKLIKFLKPNVVHTWMYHSDLLGGLIAKFYKVKIIIWSVRSSNFFHLQQPHQQN